MAKKSEKKVEQPAKPLEWIRIGELEATYAAEADRVFVRQRVQPIGMKSFMASLGADAEGQGKLTSYVAAGAAYGLDREGVGLLRQLFPPKKGRR